MAGDELAALRNERDLYLRLLELGRQHEVAPFLADALKLLVEITGAAQGYLELFEDDADDQRPSWSTAVGFSAEDVATVRAAISRGVIAATVAAGETIVSRSAMLDPRFSGRESVALARIEAVMCAPLGADPPRGVLYLQGRSGEGGFTQDDQRRVETACQHLAPLADRVLLEQHRRLADDPTQPFRRLLRIDGIVGRSAALAAVLNDVAIVARSTRTVLLTGERGTGKTQLARAIHDSGPRAGRPFVEVTCPAIPETLVESELFGALPGAATDITRRREGKVAAAERGTLFLDDIGYLPLTAQRKLLQFLQSREYYPLGGNTPIRADVRIIAATRVDLDRAAAEGSFQEDLLDRLAVFTIRMPSLAERRDDIPELAARFCREACRAENVAELALSRDALRALQDAPWPGNVRKLEHAITRAVLRAASERAPQVERRHVFPDRGASAAGRDAAPTGATTYHEARRAFEARLVTETLEACDWNVTEAARRLDIARSSAYELIRGLGIKRARQRPN